MVSKSMMIGETTRENGITTNGMDRDSYKCLTNLFIKANSLRVRDMGKGST